MSTLGTNRIRSNVPVKLLENKKYTLSISNNDFSILYYTYDSTNKMTGTITWGKNTTFTTPSGTDHAYFLVKKDDNSDISPDIVGRELFIKLEPGLVTDPVWTPAPEDVVTKTPEDIFTALGYEPMNKRIADVINGATIESVLKGKANQIVPFMFSSNTPDNPFSFSHGMGVAFHSDSMFIRTKWLLIGSDMEATKIEVKQFNFSSADEPTDDMEIN